MLRSPFPEWISFSSAGPVDESLAASYFRGASALPSSFAAERRRTFALGRLAARRAMIGLGYKPITTLPRKQDGSPEWPEGLIGSISHTADFAVAAVAEARRVGGLGMDIEDLRRAPADGGEHIAAFVADPAERDWIGHDHLRLIRLFSAKEAILKAFYPRHGTSFGFEAIHLEPTTEGFNATLRMAVGDGPQSVRFPVSSSTAGHLVLSAVWLLPSAGPSAAS